MVKRKVKLVNISDVESFNAICSKFDCDMDLSSGKSVSYTHLVNSETGK